ncbi:partial Cobyrinate a,c-diamide synthase, partial [Candidatus Brocadiaceae bacterium]
MNIALLAGTQSGCGKTSVMLALLQTLTETGVKVSSFKTGPDFLDPLWHQAVTGKPSYNLDTQMVGLENSLYQLQQHAKNADVALIEGVMGLFDGRSGVGESGSSLDLARQLNAPVWLVVDVSGMAGSIVPLVQGFCAAAQQKNVTISGIIANRVGSSYHAELIAQLLKDHQQPPLIAWLEKNAPELPERHLGLVMPESVPNFLPHFHWLDTAAWQEYQHTPQVNPHQQRLKNKTIAVARDAAFCFIYPANIDCL